MASEIVAGARVDASLRPMMSRITCGLTAVLMTSVLQVRAENIL